MSVFTPADVEAKLVALSREYDEAHRDLDAAEVEYANAEALWLVNSARCRLRIRALALESGRKVTVQEVEDESTVTCADELTRQNLSLAVVRVARANASRLRTQIDVARSVGTAVRAAMDL